MDRVYIKNTIFIPGPSQLVGIKLRRCEVAKYSVLSLIKISIFYELIKFIWIYSYGICIKKHKISTQENIYIPVEVLLFRLQCILINYFNFFSDDYLVSILVLRRRMAHCIPFSKERLNFHKSRCAWLAYG